MQYIGLFSQHVGLFSQNKPASAACTVALGSHATDTKTRSIGFKGCPPVTMGCETLRCHNNVKRDLYTYKETSKTDLYTYKETSERDLDMTKIHTRKEGEAQRHTNRGGGTEREVGGWGRVPFSRNFMKPTPRRKWYLTTGRRFH